MDNLKITAEAFQHFGISTENFKHPTLGCTLRSVQDNFVGFPIILYCKQDGFDSSKQYNDYLTILRSISTTTTDRTPILLCLINANQKVRFGISAYWIGERMFVNERPVLRSLNIDNIYWLKDCLNGIFQKRLFIIKNCKILKDIWLLTNDFPDAHVLYLRNITSVYHPTTKNDLRVDSSDFTLFGTPDNIFSSDVLDETIFNEIQTKYPHARVLSKTHICSSDIFNLEAYKSFLLAKTHISFTPDNKQDNEFVLELNTCFIPGELEDKKPLQDMSVTIDNIKFDKCKALSNTYHSISQEWM